MTEYLQTAAIVLPFGLVAGGWLWWRGVLSGGALADAPARPSPLGTFDLFIGLFLLAMGMVLASGIAAQSVTIDPETKQVVFQSTLHRAVIGLVQQLGTFGLVVAWLVFRVGSSPGATTAVGLTPRRPLRNLLWGVELFIIAVPVVMTVMLIGVLIRAGLGYEVSDVGHVLLDAMQRADSRLGLVLLIVSATLVAPVLEELVYRGLMQTALLAALPGRHWLVVFITSAAWALVHMGGVPVQGIVALFVFGLVLGYMYEKTGSLWPSIVCHCLFNVFNIVLALVLATPDAAG